jgi:two-component system chemotaxis response regulator CheY
MATAPRLLIVDDDAFVRHLLRDLLSDEGYLFSEATNGEEAVAQVQKESPDVVLLDLLMPKMSGIQALAEIRKVMPDSRVLVISSLDSEGLIQQALGAGAVGFVVKPFHPLEIKAAVKKALNTGE